MVYFTKVQKLQPTFVMRPFSKHVRSSLITNKLKYIGRLFKRSMHYIKVISQVISDLLLRLHASKSSYIAMKSIIHFLVFALVKTEVS